MQIPKKLREIVDNLPAQPGVYLFKGEAGEVLYVGKASQLSERVPQHFKQASEEPRKQALVNSTADLETIVLESESQALEVEYDLIKQHRPRFNVVYRDDKSYPYIKLTLDEAYPRVIVTREHRPESGEYFGPYTDVGSMRRTLDSLRDIFPYRSCSKDLPPGGDSAKFQPCLDYNIKRCEAPCVGKQNQAEYREMIDQLRQFLRGKYKPVREYLKAKMEEYSKVREFEAAAVYRDRLEALEQMAENSSFVQHTENADVLGLGRAENITTVELFRVRENKIVNKLEFPMPAPELAAGAALRDFVASYYTTATTVPALILLSEPVAEPELLQSQLAEAAGRQVEVRVPERGEKKQLVESAARTARLTAKNEALSRRRREGDVLHAVKELLDLPAVPRLVEGFDISTTQGRETVGSLVRFVNGEPDKDGYRRYKISASASADDYAALSEVVRRRYSRLQDEKRQLPDVVFVDGGPGQLSAARSSLDEIECDLPVISLAKQEEQLFVGTTGEVHELPEDSRVLQFFQRIRDEAHRFAVDFHRDRRQKGISSNLKEIRGLGDSRVKKLIDKFGSPVRVRQASLEELTAVPGVTEKIARRIKKRASAVDEQDD